MSAAPQTVESGAPQTEMSVTPQTTESGAPQTVQQEHLRQ